ncbi:MAG TPA: hypothetical protein VK177_09210 [Flavobacteriales bacterium]|nr:hypothetical protein [Flavobacteriales bacterium]
MINYCFSLVLVLISLGVAKADSPLTAVLPAVAYRDVPLVLSQMEGESKAFTAEECEFLFSTENPLDKKLALMNAMGWGDTTLVETYIQFLMKKYELKHEVFDSVLAWRGFQPTAYEPAAKLKADDYSCIAYLQAYGNYFIPLKAYYCAYHAVDMKPQSEAAAYIYGLVMAQFYSQNDRCGVYKVMEGIRQFDGFTADRLRPEAKQNCFDYINKYKDACQQNHEEAYYNKPESPQQMLDKKNYVDLVVLKIENPEWDGDAKKTMVRVKVKNRGTLSSIETNAMMVDLDITANEAKQRRFSKLWIEAISENNGRSVDEAEPHTKKGIDYDPDWKTFVKIPILQPGEEMEVIFELKDHWIYDSNCEIEILLDADENIQEKDEKNNVMDFVGWG